MALILFDTNIFIDMLGGCEQAAIELSNYDFPAISAITYMELRAGQKLRPHEKPIRMQAQTLPIRLTKENRAASFCFLPPPVFR